MERENGGIESSGHDVDCGPVIDLGSPQRSDAAHFLVVGIGASAGGLEALERFFDHVQPDEEMAFVVVQHLSPDFESVMDELLARHTLAPVRTVADGMQVEPGAVYLIPPRKEMIISGGKLLLTDKDPSQGLSLPIDTFLRSLAQDMGDRAVAIILSGTGSDGSRGVREVHEAGGLVLVQDEATAKFDGMPRAAIETGLADFILPPERMPGILVSHAHRLPLGKVADDVDRMATLEGGITAVFRLLREQCGIDFSHYKPSTVLRRIDRRLQLRQVMDLNEYVRQLENDPLELNSLYKDLLIGVTRFFRDPEAFQRLEADVIPQILASVPESEEIRVWIVGCATGEEAYSVAILFHEQLERLHRPMNIKIFATDVHRGSLEFASQGNYSEESLTGISPERLRRYFVRHEDSYQVIPELRKLIVFAPHNIIRDAPFTKLDLITCRNLLIYLRPTAQRKVISLFHFGLRAGGILFLGPSETPGELGEEFEPINHHWRVYRKRRDIRLPADLRLPLNVGNVQRRPGLLQPVPVAGAVEPMLLRAYDALLEEFSLPAILVNDRGEVVHVFGGASRLLIHRDGRMTSDVLQLVDKELKLILAIALQRAAKDLRPITYSGLRVRSTNGEVQIKLTVKPLGQRGNESSYMLILFQLEAPPATNNDEQRVDMEQASHARLQTLESELQYTKENLQATIEELETSNEELHATNEELVASNEELQSTNEELHSVNEELYTVNAEYQRKIEELTQLTNDMDNLLRSTDVGTIFLDRDLRIRKFTPKIADHFHLVPYDIGRRIDTFSSTLAYPSLVKDAQQVLDNGLRIERELQDQQGNWLLLRILPYSSAAGREGVVLTLIDITSLKRTEGQLRRMSKVFQDSADPIVIEDVEGRIVDLNIAAEEFYGWTRLELIGQPFTILVPAELVAEAQDLRRQCRESDHVRNVESIKLDKFGKSYPVLITLSRLIAEDGQTVGIASIAKDITRLKQAEEESREAVRRRDDFLAMLSHELRNPLGAVMNACYLLQRDPQDEEIREDACGIIVRQGRQVARLLDDLLDVSRFMRSKIEIRRDVLDLTALVPDALQAVKHLLDDRGHTLKVDISPTPVIVRGDATRLLQIQENLLVNAAKYTPRGGTIGLRVSTDGDQAVLEVTDTGQGIPPGMLDRIFDLFVQAPSSLARSEGGMGVGLTLVRKLVDLHGGTIKAESQGPGRGSRFIVRLPLSKTPEAIPERAPRPHDSRQSLNIVVVEDIADSRSMLEKLLKLDGHHVEAMPDGISGLAAILERRPDVALVDIGLPGMTGYEVAQKVREAIPSSETMLVALTGYGQTEDRKRVIEAGFDAHIVKPLTLEELNRVLELRQRR